MNVGSNIGQYRIIRKIGAGGMGTVFVGEHILLGRRAAIKTLLPALSVQREIVDRFFTEARATSAISDPGVVQVFDFGYHVDGTAYIVMELLAGESLAARLDRLGKLSAREALRITRQIAGALAAAHAQSIVHRDLKPENMFLIADGEAVAGERAKLLDFGICKISDDPTLTQTGVMLGTPVYMSPEQCQGSKEVDHRADIYGLGCVLFHMLTGRPPFDCEGTGEFIVAHLQETPPLPTKLVATLPDAVDDIVMRCLAKSPESRYQSMVELQEAIDAVLPQIIDATPVPILDAPSAMALGVGFKSKYDANFGTILPTQDLPAVTATPTPTTMGSAAGQAEPTTARSSTRSIVAILAAAVITAGIAIFFQFRGRDEVDDGLGPIELAVPAAMPAQAVPVVEQATEPAPPPVAVAAPAVAPVEATPPPPVAKRPVQRAVTVRRVAPRATPAEDLYDTR
ncbi:MAG: serine/threonine-protein kinase [Kofleriaceae bacterium]